MTSASFQPSASVNRLVNNDRKPASHIENEKIKFSNDETSADAPEVITAAPDESYVTIMVSSDDVSGKSAPSQGDGSMEASPMEETNFGMKTSFENEPDFVEKTTPTPKPFESNPNGVILNNEEGMPGNSGQVNKPPRRVSQKLFKTRH